MYKSFCSHASEAGRALVAETQSREGAEMRARVCVCVYICYILHIQYILYIIYIYIESIFVYHTRFLHMSTRLLPYHIYLSQDTAKRLFGLDVSKSTFWRSTEPTRESRSCA